MRDVSYHDDAQLALRQIGQFDLLDSDRLSSSPVECSINCTEGSLAQAIPQLLRSRSALSCLSHVCTHIILESSIVCFCPDNGMLL